MMLDDYVPFATTVILAVALASPAIAESPTLGADEILERSIAVYASCESYRDIGEAQVEFLMREGGRRSWVDRRPFRTSFRRGNPGIPDGLRFEFWSSQGFQLPARWNHYVVWPDADGIRSWWSIAGHDLHESWDMALSGPTGVSDTSAIRIPSQLLALSAQRGYWVKPETGVVLGVEEIDSQPCYHIEAFSGGGETLNVWIDTESFLVRQVQFQNRLSAGETRSTLRYQPEINVQIPASVISAEPDPGALSPPEALLELLSFERAKLDAEPTLTSIPRDPNKTGEFM